MIVSLEIPNWAGSSGAKAWLDEIGLIPLTPRERWPHAGDIFNAESGFTFIFVELTFNEVQEPFFVFSCGIHAANWLSGKTGGHDWTFKEARV